MSKQHVNLFYVNAICKLVSNVARFSTLKSALNGLHAQSTEIREIHFRIYYLKKWDPMDSNVAVYSKWKAQLLT